MSAEKIDHKAEAERCAGLVTRSYSIGALPADTVFALAQVHATLYLAEQQRIANLIEVGRDRDRQLDRELNDPNFQVVDGSTLEVSVPTELLEASNAVKVLIREGLGLA